MIELLEELIRTPGISGYEDLIRDRIKKEIEKYAETRIDTIGNLIATIGNGKHIALIAHMDEIGLVVSNIDDKGTVRISKLGGIDDRILVSRAVEIHTKKGIVEGVIGLKPPHLMIDREEAKKTKRSEMLYLDVGTRTREETKGLGVELLNPITFKKHFSILNKNMICTRGIDNRAGCLALIEMLKLVYNKELGVKLSFVWSVQEEIGLRGAKVVANTMRPDYVLAVDTYTTTDAPDMPTHLEPVKLGEGPVLRLIDSRAIASPVLREMITKVAKEYDIPLQLGITGGTTDGAAVQECGALTMPLGIPLRYTHSLVECCHKNDLENLIRLLTRTIEEIEKRER
jgi:putative aminopeptidase FrvX